MKWRKINVNDSAIRMAECVDESPSRNIFNSYIIGVLGALGLMIQSLKIILNRYAVVPFSKYEIAVYGETAVVFGIMWFFAALFVHTHFFWSSHNRLFHLADTGKVIALTGFSATLFYAVWLLLSGWLS